MQVLSVGEILWDVFTDEERLGGAPFNFCANAIRLGNSAALVSAVGPDQRGAWARQALSNLGVSDAFLQTGHEPTGVAVITNEEGEPGFEIRRPAAFDQITLSATQLELAQQMKPDWLYFGTLLQMEPGIEALTQTLAQSLPGVRCFYDMNLRPGCWNPELVERLCRLASILKLNEAETHILQTIHGNDASGDALEEFCFDWASRYELKCICITLGPDGCLVYRDGETQKVGGFPAKVHDTVGAGDAFAAAFLHGYHHNWPPQRAARFANALGSIVASRAGAIPSWTVEECLQLAEINQRE